MADFTLKVLASPVGSCAFGGPRLL